MSTVMDISELTNDVILDRWFTYLTGVGQGSDKTYETYRTQIKKLAVWNASQMPKKNLLQLERCDIRSYLAYIMEKGYAKDSVKLNVNTIRSFYDWAVDEEEAIERTPISRKIKIKGKTYRKWVPTYKQMLEMRAVAPHRIPTVHSSSKKPDYVTALAKCALNELFTTTGIRISELEQLRVDSLDFTAVVFDEELNTGSPYVGGSIYIDAYNISTKRYKEKTVWFSILTARLLMLYIKVLAISGNMPLFPWSRRTIQNWVCDAGDKIINEEPAMQQKRDRYFTDISPEILAQMPEAMRKRVKRKQAMAKGLDEHSIRANKTYSQKRKQMKPHAFRNFNACLLFHRGWNGTRHNIVYVRDCLGHSNDRQSLEYITQSVAVKNDVEWRRIMCGDARTYWHLFHHFKRI